MTVLSIRTFLVKRVEGAEIRVEKTNCFWCGKRDWCCTQCADDLSRAVAAHISESRSEKP